MNSFYANGFENQEAEPSSEIKVETDKKREYLRQKGFEIGNWIKDKLNYVYVGKNPEHDPHTYACALYVTRLVAPLERIENVLKTESGKKKLRLVQGVKLLERSFGDQV